MKNFDYLRPGSASSASEAMAAGARAKSGGTDLLGLLKHGITEPKKVVDLGRLAEMRPVVERGDVFSVGALATIAEVAANAALQRHAPCVAEAAQKTATPLVRNRATVGGNLAQRPRCWYFRHPDYPCAKKGGEICYAQEGENKYHAIFENITCNIVHPSNLAPAFQALDAQVQVRNGEDVRRVPLADFWVIPELDMNRECALEPGDLIEAVLFEKPGRRSGSCYMEVREKQSYDWALVSAAARLDRAEDGRAVRDARLIVSAVAPVPLRREEAEDVLRGKPFSEELAEKAGQAAVSGATPLRDNGYKVRLLAACVKHTLIQAWQRAQDR